MSRQTLILPAFILLQVLISARKTTFHAKNIGGILLNLVASICLPLCTPFCNLPSSTSYLLRYYKGNYLQFISQNSLYADFSIIMRRMMMD
jgi:hypothetical protein